MIRDDRLALSSVVAGVIKSSRHPTSSGFAPVQRTDLFQLYEFGAAVRPLLRLSNSGVTAGAMFSLLWPAQTALMQLLGDKPPVKVDLCRTHAQDLLEALNSIENRYFKDKDGNFTFPDTSKQIDFWEVSTLNNSAQSFETVFQAEIRKAAIYQVPKIGTYDVADLVDNAHGAFPESIHYLINKRGLDEYQQSGRCYAFGLNTASGYHACRSIEAVLRDYHKFFTGSEPSATASWGNIVEHLEKVKGDKFPSKKTMGQIRHVKDFDRNPLSHLRAVLEEVDAEILFSGAKVLILAMCQEMKEKKEAVEPTLKLVGDANEG